MPGLGVFARLLFILVIVIFLLQRLPLVVKPRSDLGLPLGILILGGKVESAKIKRRRALNVNATHSAWMVQNHSELRMAPIERLTFEACGRERGRAPLIMQSACSVLPSDIQTSSHCRCGYLVAQARLRLFPLAHTQRSSFLAGAVSFAVEKYPGSCLGAARSFSPRYT